MGRFAPLDSRGGRCGFPAPAGWGQRATGGTSANAMERDGASVFLTSSKSGESRDIADEPIGLRGGTARRGTKRRVAVRGQPPVKSSDRAHPHPDAALAFIALSYGACTPLVRGSSSATAGPSWSNL